MSCEIYREYARDHYQGDKARAIRDEDRTTGRSNFSRVCEKCRLELVYLKDFEQVLNLLHKRYIDNVDLLRGKDEWVLIPIEWG